MLDTLERLEPYSSYRYLLGLVLGGLTLYLLWSSWVSVRQFLGLLRDFNRMASKGRMLDEARLTLDPEFDLAALPPLKAQPGRVILLAALSAALRVISWRTARELAPELALAALLAGASLAAYWYVFSTGVV